MPTCTRRVTRQRSELDKNLKWIVFLFVFPFPSFRFIVCHLTFVRLTLCKRDCCLTFRSVSSDKKDAKHVLHLIEKFPSTPFVSTPPTTTITMTHFSTWAAVLFKSLRKTRQNTQKLSLFPAGLSLITLTAELHWVKFTTQKLFESHARL